VRSKARGEGGLPEGPCLTKEEMLRSGQISEFAPELAIALHLNYLKLQIADHASPWADRQGLEESASKPLRHYHDFS
jgi:hypothetical protein